MIQITADTRRAVVTNKELLTVGSAGIQVEFTLSEDWNALSKLAVFRVGDDGTKVDVVLGESLTCVVPPEVLKDEDEVLFIGVYGTNGQGTVIIPTVWASAGVVKPGTEPETPASATPTPEIWAQILSVANDAEQTATEAMSIVGAGLQDLSTLEGNVEAAEAQRVVNEQDRVAAEQQRVLAENNREAAENTRASTETVRVNAETSRVTAEAGRVSAENARVSAEAARVTAEEGRVAAEENREAHYAEYVTTVQGYANAASASATSAAGSATDAASSASSASTSAGQAASSASSASTSASQASNSASSASTSATTASSAATTATTKAGEAAASATAAGNAQTAAETAQTAAETAQSAAESAQAAAEEAAESIEESAAQISQNTQDISDVKNAISQKAPLIINSASGDVASFADGADGGKIRKIVGTIETEEGGSGWTGCKIYNEPHNSLLPQLVNWQQKLNNALSSWSKSTYVGTREEDGYIFVRTSSSSQRSYYISQNVTILQDHVCIAFITITNLVGNSAYTIGGQDYTLNTNIETNVGFCVKYATDQSAFTVRKDSYAASAGDIFKFKNIMFFDLTEMLGAEKAEYVYNLDQSNTGAGVEYFKTLFPKDFYDYSASAEEQVTVSDVNDEQYRSLTIAFTDPSTGDPITVNNGTITLNEDSSADLVVSDDPPASYHWQNVGELNTFYGSNGVWINTGSVLNCEYAADTKLYVDALTARNTEITESIAPVENGTTSTQAYAQGAYFWHDTKFCKALTAIASGATFTLNTNYTETTVAAELLAAQN